MFDLWAVSITTIPARRASCSLAQAATIAYPVANPLDRGNDAGPNSRRQRRPRAKDSGELGIVLQVAKPANLYCLLGFRLWGLSEGESHAKASRTSSCLRLGAF